MAILTTFICRSWREGLFAGCIFHLTVLYVFFFFIKEASNFVGMEDIKHIAESRNIVGDATVKISEEWDAQKELFYQRTGTKNPHEESEATEFDKELEHLLTDC